MNASEPERPAGSTFGRRTTPGRRRRRTGAAVALTAALSGIVVAGCGAVRNDYSAAERALPSSVNADAGQLALRHLRIQLGGDGPAAGGEGMLRASLFNFGEGRDALLRVTTPAAGSARLVSPRGEARSGNLALSPGGMQRLQHPNDPGWKLTGMREPLRAGMSVPVTFHFAEQGRVTVTVPVTAGV